MSSKNSRSIYFLTSAESKVKAFCNICNHHADGIACIDIPEMKMASIVIKCHHKTFGVRITYQLLDGASISGFMVQADGTVMPTQVMSKMESKVTAYTIKLEDAIRQAKEKIYKKIYSGGQWVDPAQFGLVRGAMISPELEAKEREIEEEELLNNGLGRRIIMGD